MYLVPFAQQTYEPQSIPRDGEAPPVRFHLAQVGGGDLVRLRGLIYASMGLTDTGWDPTVEARLITAFQQCPDVFVRGIDQVEGMAVPVDLARRVGLLKPTDTPPSSGEVPIRTGADFAKISGYRPSLALELALQIAKLSAETAVDMRFFATFAADAPTA